MQFLTCNSERELEITLKNLRCRKCEVKVQNVTRIYVMLSINATV